MAARSSRVCTPTSKKNRFPAPFLSYLLVKTNLSLNRGCPPSSSSPPATPSSSQQPQSQPKHTPEFVSKLLRQRNEFKLRAQHLQQLLADTQRVVSAQEEDFKT